MCYVQPRELLLVPGHRGASVEETLSQNAYGGPPWLTVFLVYFLLIQFGNMGLPVHYQSSSLLGISKNGHRNENYTQGTGEMQVSYLFSLLPLSPLL